MTTTQIVMVVAVVAIIALLVVRVAGGPRATRIDRTTERNSEDKE